jgi:ribosomal silencing factor RsfS
MITIVNVLVGLGLVGTTFAAVAYKRAYKEAIDVAERAIVAGEELVIASATKEKHLLEIADELLERVYEAENKNNPEFWKKALYEELNKLQANDYKEWDKELNTLSIEVLADWTQYLTAEDRIEFFDNIDDELRDRFNAYIG